MGALTAPSNATPLNIWSRAKMAAYPEIARAFRATAPRPIIHELPDKDDRHEVFCWIMNALRDELVAEHDRARKA